MQPPKVKRVVVRPPPTIRGWPQRNGESGLREEDEHMTHRRREQRVVLMACHTMALCFKALSYSKLSQTIHATATAPAPAPAPTHAREHTQTNYKT